MFENFKNLATTTKKMRHSPRQKMVQGLMKRQGPGRPRKENIRATVIRLDEAIYSKLRAFAKKNQMSQSAVAARAIEFLIDECEKVHHPLFKK